MQYWWAFTHWYLDIVHFQAVGSVLLLVGFLIASTLVQQRTVNRVSTVLKSHSGPIARTRLYLAAQEYYDRRNVNLFTSPSHIVPVWFLIVTVAAGACFSFFGAEYFTGTVAPSYPLGGAYAASGVTGEALTRYESSTVFIGVMAFLGAYVWMIARLTTRINNNDMSATTFYFLSIRLIAACLVAAVTRHIVEAIPVLRTLVMYDGKPVGLAALGFLIGWNPTLWIRELLLFISDWAKTKIPSQRWPAKENMPQNMMLPMIQGLVDDKIDRLNELDIDNCQDLAERNAILIWLRTPYTIELVVDWIAQAQLCILFEDDTVEKLRRAGIRTIFAYRDAIADDAGAAAVEELIKPTVPLALLATHRVTIDAEPAFQQLKELRDANEQGSTEASVLSLAPRQAPAAAAG
ncbi:MAG TPA: hypothetical protein VMH86_13910 [Rhizomicrobium sp.]|nr:hypothetical protein [Rhizomicrobium sp.]